MAEIPSSRSASPPKKRLRSSNTAVVVDDGARCPADRTPEICAVRRQLEQVREVSLVTPRWALDGEVQKTLAHSKFYLRYMLHGVTLSGAEKAALKEARALLNDLDVLATKNASLCRQYKAEDFSEDPMRGMLRDARRSEILAAQSMALEILDPRAQRFRRREQPAHRAAMQALYRMFRSVKKLPIWLQATLADEIKALLMLEQAVAFRDEKDRRPGRTRCTALHRPQPRAT